MGGGLAGTIAALVTGTWRLPLQPMVRAVETIGERGATVEVSQLLQIFSSISGQ